MQPATREEEGWLAVARLDVRLNTRRFAAATTGSGTEFIHHAPLFFLSFNRRRNLAPQFYLNRACLSISIFGEFLENMVPRNRASIGRGKSRRG